MKLYKLLVHQKTFSDATLLINPKDWPHVQVGDILQIYLPEDEYSRLLLQVQSFHDDSQPKEVISIEQSIASCFHLRAYAEVVVEKVSPKDVALDSVELFFKDQYLTRSDMWRLKEALVNSCVYINKKIEYFGIRCRVYEMWSQGERVACGVLTEDSKIVYRSASSMVYLFIQMSSEMWDFDINGDLYFEKTVNGFLSDLFAKWKTLNCNHDVTIVLFSRTFYEASNIEEFPPHMRECLQRDYKGRLFEDFYRVAVQNERYEDWSGILILLKKIFNTYQELVLEHHQRPGIKLPKAHNSCSSQGNFMEVLNMSLNVFEKHYMDRSFDRTGQLSVVISPGVGVFEVDRDLTNVTKQRIIDNGIGSDLVCLGEQPLHAVPLFKFYNKQRSTSPLIDGDNYNMPHWINLSFYCSEKYISYSKFVPRIKLPAQFPKYDHLKHSDSLQSTRARHTSQPERAFPSIFDYDDYDEQVFKLPQHALANKSLQSVKPSTTSTSVGRKPQNTNTQRARKDDSFMINSEPGYPSANRLAKTSLPLSTSAKTSLPLSSAAVVIPPRSNHPESFRASSVTFSIGNDGEDSLQEDGSASSVGSSRGTVGSAGSTYDKPFSKHLPASRLRALINPFDLSHVTIKLTSNRRRWTHVFPLGPTGIFMQQHHYQAVPQNTAATLLPPSLDHGSHKLSQIVSHSQLYSAIHNESTQPGRYGQSGGPRGDNHFSWLFNTTGDQQWTSALTTGVDWKSLVIPACLPVTTDYFPDRTSLQLDYVVSDYTLLPEDIGMDLTQLRCYRGGEESYHQASSASEVCRELVYQRLQQGFQVVVLSSDKQPVRQSSVNRGKAQKAPTECHLLSIGRIYHKLTFEGSAIKVTQFRPRHPYQTSKINYCYRFKAPDNETYGTSWVDFVSEKLENYSWNHLDHYVCQKGIGDFQLKEALKFWRLRLLLLPSSNQETRYIIDGQSEHCNIYQNMSSEECAQQRESFLRFFEILNRLRRPATKRTKLVSAGTQLGVRAAQPAGPRRFSVGLSPGQVLGPMPPTHAPFRERMGSTGASSRARSKAMDRVKGDNKSFSVSDSFDSKLSGSNTSLEGSNEVENDVCVSELKKLSVSSSHQEIIEAMKNPIDGLLFIKQPGLPNWTFISAEAVFWMLEHVDGLMGAAHAVHKLQVFMSHDLVRHASGVNHKFLHGFYLYSFRSEKESDQADLEDDLEMFEREWLESELVDPSAPQMDTLWVDAHELKAATSFVPDGGELYMRCSNMNFPGSGRSEWGQIRYHSHFKAGNAFELNLEWMVASANIVAELVLGWARKATSLGFHLVPIPSNPFALPFSSKSDPLRGPIFVPLLFETLQSYVTKQLTDDSLSQLQEQILHSFGFIEHTDLNASLLIQPPANDRPQSQQNVFVHISGSIFVISLPGPAPTPHTNNNSHNRGVQMPDDLQFICSPHEKYISRHFSGEKVHSSWSLNMSPDQKVGFLWSWNYMITKRWKTQSTGDEHFQRKVLDDFKSFCSNNNNRLQEFCDSQVMTSSLGPLTSHSSLPFPE